MNSGRVWGVVVQELGEGCVVDDGERVVVCWGAVAPVGCLCVAVGVWVGPRQFRATAHRTEPLTYPALALLTASSLLSE